MEDTSHHYLKHAIKHNLKWSTQMILEVHHLVSVPSSSHGAAQAHLQWFFFSFCKIQRQTFFSQEKRHVREQDLSDAR